MSTLFYNKISHDWIEGRMYKMFLKSQYTYNIILNVLAANEKLNGQRLHNIIILYILALWGTRTILKILKYTYSYCIKLIY